MSISFNSVSIQYFVMSDPDPCRLSLPLKWFIRRNNVDLFRTGEWGNVSKCHFGKLHKNDMPSSVRQRIFVARVKKIFVHFDY